MGFSNYCNIWFLLCFIYGLCHTVCDPHMNYTSPMLSFFFSAIKDMKGWESVNWGPCSPEVLLVLLSMEHDAN